MIRRELLGKHVWYDGERWKVRLVFQPNKHDDYLLLTRDSETSCHEDGTIPVVAVLIDCHNDEFYPDSAKIRKVMAAVRKERRVLAEAWLQFCG